MERFSVEWRGLITRDVGWTDIEAHDIADARRIFMKRYGTMRAIIGIKTIRISCDDAPSLTKKTPLS